MANNLLDLPAWIGQRASMIRFDVLDRALNKVAEINPVRGPVTIQNDPSRTIPRTMGRIVLTETQADTINIFANRLRPMWVGSNGDEYSMGVFMFATDDQRIGSYQTPLESDMWDQTLILEQPTIRSWNLPPDGSVVALIEDIIDYVGVPSFEIADVGTQTLVLDPPTWGLGRHTYLEVLRDLCQLGGYYRPYFDNWGTLQIRPIEQPSLENAILFPLGQTSRVEAGTLFESSNLIEAPNLYLVINTGPTEGEIVGSYRVPASLPYSIENRGFAVPKVIRGQAIASSGQANRMAADAAQEDAAQFISLTFSSAQDPRMDTYDSVKVGSRLYRSQAWTMDLAGGMTHRVTSQDGL